MTRGHQALALQLLLLVSGAAVVLWLFRQFPLIDYIGVAQRYVTSIGNWGAVWYPLLYAACNVLLLPGGTLALGSGLFFGLWWGTLLNVVGSTVGAAVAFALSRWALRGWVRTRLLRHPRGRVLDEAVAREGWKIVFLTQLHPLAPSSLLNYLYGVTRIQFGTCLLWVSLGQLPSAFLYAYLGTLAQLGLRLARGHSHPRLHEYIIWIGGFLLTITITYFLGRLALRILTQAESHAQPANSAPAATAPPPLEEEPVAAASSR